MGLRNETKLVLFFVIASALLGFTQVPIAEGAVSWNGFLKQVGFPMEAQIITRTSSGVINPGETPGHSSRMCTAR